LSDELSGDFDPFKTSIWCQKLKATFRPLSSKPQGKHGFSASGLIGDEAHEWKDDELYTFVHQSMGARAQPIEVIISTAGKKGFGYGWELFQESEKIRDGIIQAPQTLAIIYAAAPEDDWTDEELWKRVNPNIGISPKWDYLREEFQSAKENPRKENHFRRYHLNQWTEQETRWFPMHKWDKCTERPKDPDYWKELPALMSGRRCYAGFDLSAISDLTALVLLFPPDDTWKRWVVLPWFWVPEEAVERRVHNDRVPYDLWVKSGALQTTPGGVIDYEYVKALAYAQFDLFQVPFIGFDRWGAWQIMNQMTQDGLNIVKVGQGFASMNAPAKMLESLVQQTDELEHGNHPVLRWNAANAAYQDDPAGNIKPDKEKSGDKIDGIYALCTALHIAIGEQPDEEPPLDDFLSDPVMIG
jgi:phage terminase large subunit-like protein